MLPTPDTSHVSYERVYEPAEDSFLLLDTLSSPSETAFLHARFSPPSSSPSSSPPPLAVEIGPGSGIITAFLTAHARTIFGTSHLVTTAVDLNPHACAATTRTVQKAIADNHKHKTHDSSSSSSMHQEEGSFLGAMRGDLVTPLRDNVVDILVFNPPYVPTAELPSQDHGEEQKKTTTTTSFEEDSYLLALSYAGGRDGMETTDRLLHALPRVLSPRGCAYILLCAQNKPDEVKERVRRLEGGRGAWLVETVGSSGKKAGWEKLQVIRIWRES